MDVRPAETDAPKLALLGVRSCDLHAIGIGIQDNVLAKRAVTDSAYAARREENFVIALTCSDPGAPVSASRWAPGRCRIRAMTLR